MRSAWELHGMMRLRDGHRFSALRSRNGRAWRLVIKSGRAQADLANGPSLRPVLVFFEAVRQAVGVDLVVNTEAEPTRADDEALVRVEAFYADRYGAAIRLGEIACALGLDEVSELVTLLRTTVGIDETELHALGLITLHEIATGRQLPRQVPAVGHA